jgi:HEPN domain-containing protein
MPDERQQAIRELVEEWMRRARSDLAVARMVDEEQIAPEILAFHAQQAAEKSLKALLVQRQVEFPRLHVIGPLLNLCREAGYEETEFLADAVTLTRYAVAPRYPGEEEPVSREEAAQAFELAEKVLSWVETKIEGPHPNPAHTPRPPPA